MYRLVTVVDVSKCDPNDDPDDDSVDVPSPHQVVADWKADLETEMRSASITETLVDRNVLTEVMEDLWDAIGETSWDPEYESMSSQDVTGWESSDLGAFFRLKNSQGASYTYSGDVFFLGIKFESY